MNGLQLLCDVVRRLGIETVFGVPGTQTVALFEALRRSQLRTVLAASELGATFMACGYYRASGKIAAVSTIPGPGFTWSLTGIAEARLDSTPLILLVGTAATSPGRRFQLQAVDQEKIAGPLAKATLLIDDPRDVAAVMTKAVRVALSDEPGPVMVQVNLSRLDTDIESIAAVADERPALASESVQLLVRQLFTQAERPVFLLGQGALGVATRLQMIVEALQIPVVTTPSARGIIPEDHPMAIGYDPLRQGTNAVNELFATADLILGLGCKLGHNGSAGFQLRLPEDRFVHVDADAGVLGANYNARWQIHERVENVIAALETRTTPARWESRVPDIRLRVRISDPDSIEPIIEGAGTGTARDFFVWLQGALPPGAIVVTDSGMHQVLARRYLDVLTPRGLVIPSDFQSMGFGMPAAVGASFAQPDQIVVAIVGDGGFLMSGLEILTARRDRARVFAFVFNDGTLGQIRRQQLLDYGYTHAVEIDTPDFSLLAQSLGVDYFRFEASSQGAIASALRTSRVALTEVIIGDSFRLQRRAAVVRAKSHARRALGKTLRDWITRRLIRTQ